ncbi:MAG: GGDEF domain-containing protein [Deltaproteobacteria bacterium]|nr:GGDEF domain-containing protein [Deltaproteobacteria bacterium]
MKKPNTKKPAAGRAGPARRPPKAPCPTCVDPESGFFHEEHFLRTLSSELARVQESGKPLGLLILSLEGKPKGIYPALAAVFAKELRKVDVPARLSAGGIAVILPRVNAPRLSRLIEALERLASGSFPGLKLGYGFASCGPGSASEPAALLKGALDTVAGPEGLLRLLKEVSGKHSGSALLAEEKETLFKGFSSLCGKDDAAATKSQGG